MTNPTPHGQVPEALEDFEVRKLAAIGAVRTSSGLVERRPFDYRRELENQFVRGFRAAEKRLSALSAAPAEAPPVSAYSDRALREAILKGLSRAELRQKALYLMELNSNQAREIGKLQSIAASPTPPATQQAGEMEVFGLQWPGEDRINLSTVFDTEAEALEYMQNRCDTPGIRLVRFSSKASTAQAAESVPAREHDLQDVRCECCGYMTYHREHMGCIHAARKQGEKQ